MLTEKPLTKNIRPNEEPLDIAGYVRAGGYLSVTKAIKELAPKDVVQLVRDSTLMGRGGAGVSTGFKMGTMPQGENAPKTKYLVCNADEMEPGTFKDRLLLEGDPHQLVEGMVTAAYGIGASAGYIFLRGEYKLAQKRVEKALAGAYNEGFLGKNILGSGWNLDLHLHMSAGRYICGEETALINALEGKRANPRAKPPFPPQSGLWGKPTLVDNVETLCNIPHIVNNGAEWYKSLSRGIDGGTKLYGVSGRVKRPGCWELPMGTPARELLFEHAGGMQEGFQFRAVLPGGASTDFWLEDKLDLAMDFSSSAKAGTRMGTGTMIVIDDKVCPVGVMLNLERFFKQESCGWCTPCRDGLSWVAQLLTAIENGNGREEDMDLLQMHSRQLGGGNTFCALAPGAASPLSTGLRYFHDELRRHIAEKKCPYRGRH